MSPREALERLMNCLCNDCCNSVCSGGNKNCYWFNLYKEVESGLLRLEVREKQCLKLSDKLNKFSKENYELRRIRFDKGDVER